MFADSRTRCPPTSNTSRCIAGHVYPYLCSAECRDNRLLLFWPRYERNKISQNGIDKKLRIPAFYQYHSGCVFYYRRIARKAEAGRDGSPRSINKSAMCPAMWRLTFSGGGRSVRLSANGCQPHRPNTALLFCAAGYRPGLLRTFREHDLNFYYFESCARPPSVLRDILKGEPRHWRYAESAFLPEPVQRFYYSAGNEKMQRYSSFFMASMR